jgi:MFS family permease
MTPVTTLARPTLHSRWASLSEGLTRPFWAMLAGTFITRFGSFVVPLLFVYLTQRRGLDLVNAGRVASLYGLGALGGSMAGGVLADRIGRRATMLGALVSGAASMLLLGVSTEIWQLALASLALGLTGDAFRPASQALIADIVPPEHRMKAFGIQYWAINLGFTFAALIGGYMASRNFDVLFFGDAATTLVLAAIVFRWVPESHGAEARAQRTEGSLLTPFFDRVYLPFLVLNFLVALVFFQHLTGLPEDMHQKGLSTEAFGVAIAFNGVLIVLLQPAVSTRAKHVSRATLLAVAAALTGLGFGLTAFATTLPWYVVTVAVWTMAEILFAPVNASIVADLSPKHLRGRYQGAFTITWSLAFMVSPLVGPWLMGFGMNVLWGACAAVGLGTAAVHLLVTARVLPPTTQHGNSSEG